MRSVQYSKGYAKGRSSSTTLKKKKNYRPFTRIFKGSRRSAFNRYTHGGGGRMRVRQKLYIRYYYLYFNIFIMNENELYCLLLSSTYFYNGNLYLAYHLSRYIIWQFLLIYSQICYKTV